MKLSASRPFESYNWKPRATLDGRSATTRHQPFSLVAMVAGIFMASSLINLSLLSAEDDCVEIRLRCEVVHPGHRITLGDIAEIVGGPIGLRQGLSRLELEEANNALETLIITKRRVIYRIQLAGIDINAVQIVGADEVKIIRKANLQSDLQRVSYSGQEPRSLGSSAKPATEPRLVRSGHPQGQANRREGVDGQGTLSARPSDVAQGEAVIVRKGDFVRLVARVGPLEVSTRGEALADGKLGQIIPVRNLDSKQTVHARVTRPAVCQVDY